MPHNIVLNGRERDVLMSYLDAQREHVLEGLEGLSDEALRRPVMPSGWTCLGLVRHLAIDVERLWFSVIMGSEESGLDDGMVGWEVSDDTPPGAVFDLYRREINAANAVISRLPLEAEPVRWPKQWANWHLADLREIMLHVITETACHAGHLDAARELIDGGQWLVNT